jgi:RND family efflux transporter MFP subunit
VETPSPVSAIPVSVTAVQPAPEWEDLPVSGLLTSETEARLSFKTGGIIQRIFVREGDSVTDGTLLAVLNLTEINAQVDQANEALLKADRDLARVKALFTTSVATQEQWDNAKTAYQVALRSRDIAGYNRSFSEIRASGPGVIVKKLMNEGELAGPGNPVFLISGSAARDWVLRCSLSDVQWAKTNLGDRAFFSLDAYPGVSWVGRVTQKGAGAEEGTGLYRIEIQVQPGPHPLALGLFGKGRVQVRAVSGAWQVPSQAVVGMHGDSGEVFVVENGRAKPIPVTVVRWTGDHLNIKGELNPSVALVDSGAPYLAAGSFVQEVAQP